MVVNDATQKRNNHNMLYHVYTGGQDICRYAFLLNNNNIGTY